jgi:hypothetical protein
VRARAIYEYEVTTRGGVADVHLSDDLGGDRLDPDDLFVGSPEELLDHLARTGCTRVVTDHEGLLEAAAYADSLALVVESE